MSEATADTDKKKRFRSPPYPAIDLTDAVDRAQRLYGKAHMHSVGAQVVAEAFGMKSADGKVWRIAAALIQYGLLTDSGTGTARKFQLTDSARRILLDDPNSVRRKEALRAAALSPMIHKELWEKFGTTTGLADSVIQVYLTLDRADLGESTYNPNSAGEVLANYRASLAYAGVSDSDKNTPEIDKESEEKTRLSHKPVVKINIGDYVKWTSGGVDQFLARQVEWISDDGTFLRVVGNMAGIPMTEVTKVEPIQKPAVAVQMDENPHGASSKGKNITTSIVGNRLQISADVGEGEIDALKDMLTKYQEILKLLH